MKHIQLFFYCSLLFIPRLWGMEADLTNAIILAHCNIIPQICQYADLRTTSSLLRSCTAYHDIYEQVPTNLTKDQVKKLQFGIDSFLLQNPATCLSFKKHEYINTFVHYAQTKNIILLTHLFTYESKSNRIARQAILKTFDYNNSKISALYNIKNNIRAFRGLTTNKVYLDDKIVDTLFKEKKTDILRILILNNAFMSAEYSQKILHKIIEYNLKSLRHITTLKTLINRADSFGDTPLHKAAHYNRPLFVQLLLDYKANINIENNSRSYPIDTAAFNQHKKIFLILLEQFPVYYKNNKWNVLHLLTKEKATTLYKSLRKMFIPHDINAQDIDHWTPLHIAVLNKCITFVRLLLNDGADINSTTNKGNTPLHIACFQNDRKIIKMLIKHGADTTIKNNQGETALVLKYINHNNEDPEDL